ncbi:MAG: LysM peptidoglycan-binding domain-containing protein [Acidobacteriota bacterium]
MKLDGRRLKWILLTLTSVPLAWAGCTPQEASVKRGDTAPSPEVRQEEAPPVVLSQEPEYVARQRERDVALVARDARLLRGKAKEMLQSGRPEQGRAYLEEALSLLSSSGFEVSDFPSLETVQSEVMADIRRLDVSAAVTPDETPFPLTDEVADSVSPLDEIASLDLYAVKVDPRLENLVDQDLKQTPFDFPIVVNQEVLKFLDYYQGRGRPAMEAALRRSGRYVRSFRKTFAEAGLPQDLVFMAHVESLFKPTAYSRARARGIWQFMAGTAKLYGLKVGWWVDERLDSDKATRVAARYLKDLHDEFGDWYLVLAAYNVGKGRVSRVLKRHGDLDYWDMVKRRLLPRETRNFVPSILAAMIIYRNPEKYGFDVDRDPPEEYEKVPVDFQADLKVVAEAIGVDADELAALNPELLRGITPAEGSGYELKVPVGLGAAAAMQLAQIPPEKRLRWTHHRVRSGQTLSQIAGQYGVSIRAIAEINHIRNVNRLSLGQNLVIPLSDWRASMTSDDSMGGGSHIVRRGDSLYKIARHYGVRLSDLFRWNHLGPGDVIHPGQEILVVASDSAGN